MILLIFDVFSDYFQMKAACVDTQLMMNLPYLEFDGTILTEAVAIMRSVANVGGLVPADPVKAAHMDQALLLSSEFVGLLALHLVFRMRMKERKHELN